MSDRPSPVLVEAASRAPDDIGEPAWDSTTATEYLEYSNQDRSVEWARTPVQADADPDDLESFPPAWFGVPSRLRLHSGEFEWDFTIDEMSDGQIGVGFMLDWNIGPDWGFFGYLGASTSAWAYDPSTGDVVRATQSIEGGLPKFENRHTGTVSIRAHLHREAVGSARFVVAGVASKPIVLPRGAVLIPAGCLLRAQQKITLAGLRRVS